MERNRQINDMARAMCFQRESCTAKSCINVNCEKTWLAEALYNAGYRKASDVAREIFEEIESELLNDITDYHGCYSVWYQNKFAELKKKYTEGEG